MRRSLLHSRRLRCFFEADSRTPFRHSPLREETAFREKPHFPAREALLPCFFCHPAEIPRLRFGRLPCLRPIAVPPQRNPLHTESHASDTMFSQADRFSSGNTAASGSKNRASKPCRRKPAREECPLPLSSLLLSVLRHAPWIPTDVVRDRDKREASRNTEKLYSPASRRIVFDLSRSEAEPSPPEHPTSTGEETAEKNPKRDFPAKKSGNRPIIHPPTSRRMSAISSCRKAESSDSRSSDAYRTGNHRARPPYEILLSRSDPPAARRNVSGSGSRKPSLSLSRTGRSSSEPEPQEKALRNTESRPDPPAARRTISGSGLRKPSLSFEGTFPDEIRTGSRRRVPRQDGKRSASPDRQQPSPSEHAPLRKTCAPREHNGSRGARVIRRTARDRSRHRPVALRSGSVRS